MIVFSPREGREGVFIVHDNGGDAKPLAPPSGGGVVSTWRWPDALPGGSAVVFTMQQAGTETEDIAVQSLTTGERHVLVEGGAHAQYVSSGHLAYMSGGTLMAIPFDLRSGQTSGTPIAAVTDILHGPGGAAMIAVSRSGSLAYIPGGLQQQTQHLVWVDRTGSVSDTGATPRDFGQFTLSPDGVRIAFTPSRGDSDVWTYDLLHRTFTRLTFDGVSTFPLWSPDGSRLAYTSFKNGVRNVYEQPANGGAEVQITRCTPQEGACVADSWSPDGRQLVFHQLTPDRSPVSEIRLITNWSEELKRLTAGR